VLAHWRGAGGGTHARDTADLARFDEAIEQAIAEAIGLYVRQTKSATDLFIGILGHDIRNPLGTILASAEYLVRSRQLTAGTAAPILNAAARIHGIVEQTMDFSRTQSHGAMPVRRVAGNLGNAAGEGGPGDTGAAPDRPLLYDVRTRPAGQLGRAAARAGAVQPAGQCDGLRLPDGVVTVRAWSEAGHGCFSVHNHGVPIPAEEQQHIFEPLVRGHAAIVERRGRGGLGLGLYICREIVRAHGGTMAVESSPAPAPPSASTCRARPRPAGS
jgi:signal transduction histidine kinase